MTGLKAGRFVSKGAQSPMLSGFQSLQRYARKRLFSAERPIGGVLCPYMGKMYIFGFGFSEPKFVIFDALSVRLPCFGPLSER